MLDVQYGLSNGSAACSPVSDGHATNRLSGFDSGSGQTERWSIRVCHCAAQWTARGQVGTAGQLWGSSSALMGRKGMHHVQSFRDTGQRLFLYLSDTVLFSSVLQPLPPWLYMITIGTAVSLECCMGMAR